MSLTLPERAAVANLAKHLYNFLPASGNTRTSFPLAAQKVDVGEAWPDGRVSKEPGIVAMLTWTLPPAPLSARLTAQPCHSAWCNHDMRSRKARNTPCDTRASMPMPAP